MNSNQTLPLDAVGALLAIRPYPRVGDRHLDLLIANLVDFARARAREDAQWLENALGALQRSGPVAHNELSVLDGRRIVGWQLHEVLWRARMNEDIAGGATSAAIAPMNWGDVFLLLGLEHVRRMMLAKGAMGTVEAILKHAQHAARCFGHLEGTVDDNEIRTLLRVRAGARRGGTKTATRHGNKSSKRTEVENHIRRLRSAGREERNIPALVAAACGISARTVRRIRKNMRT